MAINIDGSDIGLTVFLGGIMVVTVCWIQSASCQNMSLDGPLQCARACGPNRMADRDRDGNCRCVVEADASVQAIQTLHP